MNDLTQIPAAESIGARRGHILVQWAYVVMWSMALSLSPAHAHDFKLGDLVIDHPYATPSLAGTRNGSVYFKGLRNRGGQADRLIAAKSAVAERVELHQMQMDGTIMRMREVPAIELPARTEVNLRHGGAGTHHLMLQGLRQPLKDGDRFDLELVFEKAGTRKVNVWVQTPRSGNATHTHPH
jgi:periplasmic copper chaperone A